MENPYAPSEQDREQLCERCTSVEPTIDWYFSNPALHSRAAVELGRIAQRPRGSCRLCDYFLDILPAEAKKGDNAFYSYQLQGLYRMKRLPVVLNESNFTASNLLLRLAPIPQVMPSVTDENGPGIPFLHVRQLQEQNFKRLTDQIDFDIPKGWLDRCTSEHAALDCRKRNARGPLKLIDCGSRSIVKAPLVDFVALSYVWGPQATQSLPGNRTGPRVTTELLKDIPKTVEDAITVTKKLGYNYLWVDKFCIDQDQSQERASEIQRMDAIYRSADVTIVDASGNDPHHGLPGVRPNSRSPHQPSLQLGKYELLSGMTRPRSDIHQSKWNTRGWTYQEGILSRRRLLFTPHQLFFHCQTESCKEATYCIYDLPRQHYQKLPTVDRVDGIGDQITCFVAFRLIKFDSLEILNCVKEYSRRTLTKDDDILNGILGLFRYTASLPQPIFHIWGLPLLATGTPVMPDSDEGIEVEFFYQLFFWTLKRPSARWSGFPSVRLSRMFISTPRYEKQLHILMPSIP